MLVPNLHPKVCCIVDLDSFLVSLFVSVDDW
jgi:hypothetical protein